MQSFGALQWQLEKHVDFVKKLELQAERAKLHFAFGLASLAFGVDPRCLESGDRMEQKVSDARQVGMYIAHVLMELTPEQVSKFVGRDPSTVRHGIERVEDRRDIEQFDNILTAVEAFAKQLTSEPINRFLSELGGFDYSNVDDYDPEFNPLYDWEEGLEELLSRPIETAEGCKTKPITEESIRKRRSQIASGPKKKPGCLKD